MMMIGAAAPIAASEGMKPMAAVARPMSVMVMRNVYLRPKRSPKEPNRAAHNGRKPKPTANQASESSNSMVAFTVGKKPRNRNSVGEENDGKVRIELGGVLII